MHGIAKISELENQQFVAKTEFLYGECSQKIKPYNDERKLPLI